MLKAAKQQIYPHYEHSLYIVYFVLRLEVYTNCVYTCSVNKCREGRKRAIVNVRDYAWVLKEWPGTVAAAG